MALMDPVRAYHERSKHRPERYAPGPGGLDWDSQPDPFRRYAGAPQLDLPLLAGELPVRWDDLFGADRVVPPGDDRGQRGLPVAVVARFVGLEVPMGAIVGRCAAIRRAATCIPRRAT